MFAIRFAKTKAYTERNIELDLQKLEEMNLHIDATPENSSLVNEARKLKIELDEIAMQRTKGSTIRSRARWYELGEKCNKYFFSFEKRSYEKRHNKIEDTRGYHCRGSIGCTNCYEKFLQPALHLSKPAIS